jgi:hypothetical protein
MTLWALLLPAKGHYYLRVSRAMAKTPVLDVPVFLLRG